MHPAAVSDAQCLAETIRTKLKRENILLIESALSQLGELDALFEHVTAAVTFNKADPFGKVELTLLRAILDFEEKRNDLSKWGLAGGGLDQIRRDFLLLSKFFTKFSRGLNNKVDVWGKFFL